MKEYHLPIQYLFIQLAFVCHPVYSRHPPRHWDAVRKKTDQKNPVLTELTF